MRRLVAGVLVGLAFSANPALAQVSAHDDTAWYFEIDADYGSVLGAQATASEGYLRAVNVTDGEGSLRRTAFGRLQGVAVGSGLPACTPWWHDASSPYMGTRSYKVECRYKGERSSNPPVGATRRSEQMLVDKWVTGDDSGRYFTLAFKFAIHPNTAPKVPGGYVTQWHHGTTGPPAARLSWTHENGAYYLEAGVNYDSEQDDKIFEQVFKKPVAAGTWHRLLFEVSPGPGWGVPACERCPTGAGYLRAWMMNAQTGEWELLAERSGQLGYRFTREGGVRRYRTGKELEYQWKVGHYANEVDYVILDYDNVAYGKRWNNITKNRLIGHHKSVLSLSFDEGQGATVNDSSWIWNGGEQGDPVMDYDNDGAIVGNVTWNAHGVGNAGRSLEFNGGHVRVPIDKTDFDFGNYVTVSAWFKTTQRHGEPRGLVSIDEDPGGGKLFLASSGDRLSFGVKHADGSYSQVSHIHRAGLYADGRWHHVVGTFNRFAADSRRVKIYVDGKRVSQKVGRDRPMQRGDSRLVVGRFGTSGYFRGHIDEVNLMNFPMTDTNVAALYVKTGRPARTAGGR